MTAYLWFKALHIIFVICWFAGIFYLPRLFVYHASAQDAISKERFKVMERKLYRVIMNPSMILTLVFGILLLVERWQAYSTHIWLWLKIALVVGLIGYHHYCLKIIKAFARDENPHSEKFYRIFNELPVLVLFAIVILVVLKPFM
ncbi:MAG: protoporphyrinogen oxidase HemJ [Pseudomonadales bacterium]